MSRKVIFKTYDQDQLSLLPPSYDDLVPVNHLVRIVNMIIDNVDISAIEKTFMRKKDDHMQNGQLKPAYNVQASTNNQYLTNYTLAQTTADTTTLKNHVNDHIEKYDEKPETLTADAGYGSEENYTPEFDLRN